MASRSFSQGIIRPIKRDFLMSYSISAALGIVNFVIGGIIPSRAGQIESIMSIIEFCLLSSFLHCEAGGVSVFFNVKKEIKMKQILMGLALVLGLMLQACNAKDEMAVVSPVDAQAWASSGEAVIVDVREQGEWDAGHIDGAIFIPLGQLEKRLGELDAYKGQKVVLQCRSGKRSAAATAILTKAGFKQAHNMTGGIIAWDKAGLATVK